jgi:pimeloyl-ACP methyl ester carboxylesterase
MIVKEFYVPSSYGDGYYIHLKVKSPNENYDNALLMLHGLTLPPSLNYDSKINGCSAADLFVNSDVCCIMMSALGYGKSSLYPEMYEEPKIGNINTYDDWNRDLDDVLNWLKTELSIKKISIVGWSGGAIPAANASIRHTDIVSGLIVYGITDYVKDDNAPNENITYKWYDISTMKKRRYRGIPEKLKPLFLPESWYQDWQDNISEVMPLKVPNGTENNRFAVKRGERNLEDFIRWQDVTVPVLFTTGEWDIDINHTEFKNTLDLCSSKDKYFKLAKYGAHWIILEKFRQNMIDIMADFVKKYS